MCSGTLYCSGKEGAECIGVQFDNFRDNIQCILLYSRYSASAVSDGAYYQLKLVQVLGQKCRIQLKYIRMHSQVARMISSSVLKLILDKYDARYLDVYCI